MKEGKFKNKRTYQFDVIQKHKKVNKKINVSVLSRELNTSRKQVYFLLKKYIKGSFFIDHGNINKKRERVELKNQICKEYLDFVKSINEFRKDNHYTPNFANFFNLLIKDKYHVCQKSVYNYLISSLIFSPDSNKKTKKEIRSKLRKQGKIDILKTINDSEEIKKIKPYKKQKSEGFFGDTVEIDACQHYWFNGEQYHIYAAVDKSSGYLLALHMEKEETTKGYCILLNKLFKRIGKPRLIITDKRRTFWINHYDVSHMKESLNDLDVELYSSSEPTAKPNVERAFRNMQDLFPFLYYKNKITNYENALEVIDDFSNEYNKYYKKEFVEENSFIPVSDYDVDLSMTLKKKVKIRNGSYLVYNNLSLAPFNKNNERVLLKEKSEVLINIAIHKDELFIKHLGQKLTLKKVSPDDIFANLNNKEVQLQIEKIAIEKQKRINRRIQANLLKKKLSLMEREKYIKICEKELGII